MKCPIWLESAGAACFGRALDFLDLSDNAATVGLASRSKASMAYLGSFIEPDTSLLAEFLAKDVDAIPLIIVDIRIKSLLSQTSSDKWQSDFKEVLKSVDTIIKVADSFSQHKASASPFYAEP